eukprot:COSAG02_NODE_2779_length_8046_cov_3.495533_4_plen_141_part_00
MNPVHQSPEYLLDGSVRCLRGTLPTRHCRAVGLTRSCPRCSQAVGQFRNPSRYGYGSPRPVADLQAARDAEARRAAAERRELRLDSSETQHHPAHTVVRFTRKAPTPADHLAARKAVVEAAIDDLRGAGSWLSLAVHRTF